MKKTLIEKLIERGKRVGAIAIIAGTMLSATGCVVNWSNLSHANKTNTNVKPNIKEETSDVSKIEIDPDMAKKVVEDLNYMASFVGKPSVDGTTSTQDSMNGFNESMTDFYDRYMPDTLGGELTSEETEKNITIDTKYNVGGLVTTPSGLVSEEAPNTTSTSGTTAGTGTTSTTPSASTSSTGVVDFTATIDLIKKCIKNKLNIYATNSGVDSSSIPSVDEIAYVQPTKTYIQVGVVDNTNGNFVKINFSTSKSAQVLEDLNAFYSSNSEADMNNFASSCTSAIDYASVKGLTVAPIVSGVNSSAVASSLNLDTSLNYIVCVENFSPTKTADGRYKYTFQIHAFGKTSCVGPMESFERNFTSNSKLSRAGVLNAVSNLFGGNTTSAENTIS